MGTSELGLLMKHQNHLQCLFALNNLIGKIKERTLHCYQSKICRVAFFNDKKKMSEDEEKKEVWLYLFLKKKKKKKG